MNYKDEFISNTKERYAEAVKAKNVRENAEIILASYFTSLKKDLETEIEATRGLIKIQSEPRKYSVIFEGAYLEILNHGDVINVAVPRPGNHFTDKLDFTPQGYYSKKFDAYLEEDLLNQYLKEAFDKIV